MKPSIGRLVHYFPTINENYGNSPVTALITHVWSDTCVNLKLFADGPGVMDGFKTSVNNLHSDNSAGSWNWPERV